MKISHLLAATAVTFMAFFIAAQQAWAGYYVIAVGGPKAKQTLMVSPVIGNNVASGTALLKAVAKAHADGIPLVLIEPGTYDLQDQTLNLSGVELQGMGQYPFIASTAATTIHMLGQSRLRHLSVFNNAPGDGTAVLIENSYTNSRTLDDVKADANTGGKAQGVWVDSANLTLNNVTASGTTSAANTPGVGILVGVADVILESCSATGNGLTFAAGMSMGDGARVTAQSCTFLSGGTPTGAGTAVDINAAADGNFTKFTMQDSLAVARGTTAVYLTALKAVNADQVVINDCSFEVPDNGDSDFGMDISNSKAVIRDSVVITDNGAIESIGMLVRDGATVTVHNSQINDHLSGEYLIGVKALSSSYVALKNCSLASHSNEYSESTLLGCILHGTITSTGPTAPNCLATTFSSTATGDAFLPSGCTP